MSENPAVELDYAFLAQWARANDDGTLTAIDASFLRITAPIGAPAQFAVATRLRFKGGLTECALQIDVEAPGTPHLTFGAQIDAGSAPAYGPDNRRHVIAVLNTGLQVQNHGTVTVRLSLDERPARTLLFELVPRSALPTSNG